MSCFHPEQVPAIHLVEKGNAKRVAERGKITRRIHAHLVAAIKVVHLAIRFLQTQVFRFLDAPAVQENIVKFPARMVVAVPQELPRNRPLEAKFVTWLKIAFFEESKVFRRSTERHVPREFIEAKRRNAQPMETVHAGTFARREPPADIDTCKRERHQFHAQVRFVETVHPQVHHLMNLVMGHRIPLVTHESVGKIPVDAKAIAGRILPRHIDIATVHVITKLRKGAQQHKTFGSAHRRNRLAGKKREGIQGEKERYNRKYAVKQAIHSKQDLWGCIC